ncbi:MAG: NAD-dependent succinate-semialdehyde dehydrogenase [Deltaproteobacteria bacterium]|nr:NAD-dependent succinate-semialdehyde dehydrogenase [Kofleriaceae bacterium]
MPLVSDAFIDGRWVPGAARFVVRDPFDDAQVAEVTDCGEAEVDAAIDAAARAFGAWRQKPALERGKLLAQLAAAMLRDERRLAELCTRENGKALKEAVAEVRYAASFFDWFAGEAGRAYGETIPGSRPDQRIVVTREPVGPCALITPWNFPYAMLARKLGAALAAGCTTVAKPAELTPLGALAIAQLAEQVGVPPGVINVVPTTNARRCGAQLLASPAIRKLSFTGSTAVGRELLRTAADDIKRVSLELGGNAPFVVLADADLDEAVAGAMVAKFRNGGQSCVAANRFIVERAIADAFVARLLPQVQALVVGRGLDAGTDLGPLVDDRSVAKVRRLVEDARAKGATLLHDAPIRGRLVGPVVLGGVTPAMDLWREEIFGPVIAIRTAADEADALAQANDTEYGLVAYVFTRDGARQQRLAERLESGMVGVNTGLVSTAQAPFGGIKHSGFGREGSRHGLDDYTHLKYVSTR